MTNAIEPLKEAPATSPQGVIRLSLGEAIDPRAVRDVNQKFSRFVVAPPHLVLDCTMVRIVDSVGAALLWLLCMELEQKVGTRLSLIHVPVQVSQRLRYHPLLQYVTYGEELFQDPFGTLGPSDR
jgi:anti-anti-sigma regulatory factor